MLFRKHAGDRVMSHHEPIAAPGFGYQTMSPSKRSLLGLAIFPDEIISSEVAEFDAEPARYGSVPAKVFQRSWWRQMQCPDPFWVTKNGMLL